MEPYVRVKISAFCIALPAVQYVLDVVQVKDIAWLATLLQEESSEAHYVVHGSQGRNPRTLRV